MPIKQDIITRLGKTERVITNRKLGYTTCTEMNLIIPVKNKDISVYLCFRGQNMMTVNKTYLEFNPIEIGYDGLLEILNTIFCNPTPNDFIITRIDLCVDIPYPVEYIYRTLILKYKRGSDSHFRIRRSNKNSDIKISCDREMNGFYIGKNPAVLRVYNKKASLSIQDKHIAGLPEHLTRIEWQLRHRKCPVRSLNDIHQLKNMNPFENLCFLRDTPYDKVRYKKKAAILGSHRQVGGMQYAYRKLNRQGHFKRDYRDLTVYDEDIAKLIRQEYEKRIRVFLEGFE